MRTVHRRVRSGLPTVAACMLLVSLGTAAARPAVDLSSLPQSCRDAVAQLQAEKGRFGALGSAMTQARKTKNSDAFCSAAREIITLIKAQSSSLDVCAGELGSAQGVQPGLAGQMTALKAVYQNMLTAAKNAKYDHFRCGLADQ